MVLTIVRPVSVLAVVLALFVVFTAPAAAAPGVAVTNPEGMDGTPADGKVGVMPGDNVSFPDTIFDEKFPDTIFDGNEKFPDTIFSEKGLFPDTIFNDGEDKDGSDPVIAG